MSIQAKIQTQDYWKRGESATTASATNIGCQILVKILSKQCYALAILTWFNQYLMPLTEPWAGDL